MEIRFHKRVQVDLDEPLKKYYDISFQLGEDFFAEFQIGLAKVSENPRFSHFDPKGLRRCNLERFPYHFLYDIRQDGIRVCVLRHDRRRPAFGLTRFKDKPK